MTCTIDKVLSDARLLVSRLRDHENQADGLISHGQSLHNRVDAMKQYSEDLSQLNEVARHRPRSSLIINLLAENTQIRDLQTENRELRLALDEHQAALDMIMSKYRQQVQILVRNSRLDKSLKPPESYPVDVDKIDKIVEMASVMKRAISLDDKCAAEGQAMIAQLKFENENLRQLLNIASKHAIPSASNDAASQTECCSAVSSDLASSADQEEHEAGGMNEVIDAMFDMNSSIISIKPFESDVKFDADLSYVESVDTHSMHVLPEGEDHLSSDTDSEHNTSSTVSDSDTDSNVSVIEVTNRDSRETSCDVTAPSSVSDAVDTPSEYPVQSDTDDEPSGGDKVESPEKET